MEKDLSFTQLGKDVKFIGEAFLDGKIIIHGNFSGSLKKKSSLDIQNLGSIQGEINSTQLTNFAKIKGKIQTQEIFSKKESSFEGSLHTENIFVEKGAKLKGDISMEID